MSCKFIPLLLFACSLLFAGVSAQAACEVGDFLKLCPSNPLQDCDLFSIVTSAGCGVQDTIVISGGWGATGGPTLTFSGKTLYALNVSTSTFSNSVNIKFSGASNITQNLYLGGYAKINITQGASVKVGGFMDIEPTSTLELHGNISLSESSQVNGTIIFSQNAWLISKSPLYLEGTQEQQAMLRGAANIDGNVQITGNVNFNYGSGSAGSVYITQALTISSGSRLTIAGSATAEGQIQITGSVVFPNIHDSIYNVLPNWLISLSSSPITMSGTLSTAATITGSGNIGGNLGLSGLAQLNYGGSYAVNCINVTGNVTLQHSSYFQMAGNLSLQFPPILYGTIMFPNKTMALTANLNAPSVAVWGAVIGSATIAAPLVSFYGSVKVNEGNDGDALAVTGSVSLPTTSTLLLAGTLSAAQATISGALIFSDTGFLAASIIKVNGNILGNGYMFGEVQVMNGTAYINSASPSSSIIATTLTVFPGSTLLVGGIISTDSKVHVSGVLNLVSNENFTATVSSVGVIVFDASSVLDGTGIINGPAQFIGTSSVRLGAAIEFSHYGGIIVASAASLEILGNVTVSSGNAVIQGELKLTSSDSQSGLLAARSVVLGAANGSLALVTGTGAIQGNVSVVGNVSMGPITLYDDLRMSDQSALQLSFASTKASNFVVGKTFYRAGSLYLTMLDGFEPAENDTISFATHAHAWGDFSAVLGNTTFGVDVARAVYADVSTSIIFAVPLPTLPPTPAPTSPPNSPPQTSNSATSPPLNSEPGSGESPSSSPSSSPSPSTGGAGAVAPLVLLGLAAFFVSLL